LQNASSIKLPCNLKWMIDGIKDLTVALLKCRSGFALAISSFSYMTCTQNII
jgi:hypothetical protein